MRFLLIFAMAMGLRTPVVAAEPVTGRWLTEEKTGVVEIAPCGANLCGTIVRVIGPQRETADLRDANNPNAALRSRRIVGLPILTGFTRRDGYGAGGYTIPTAAKAIARSSLSVRTAGLR